MFFYDDICDFIVGKSNGFVEKESIIDVANANTLTLIVEDSDNNKGCDHASWGDAYLTK